MSTPPTTSARKIARAVMTAELPSVTALMMAAPVSQARRPPGLGGTAASSGAPVAAGTGSGTAAGASLTGRVLGSRLRTSPDSGHHQAQLVLGDVRRAGSHKSA